MQRKPSSCVRHFREIYLKDVAQTVCFSVGTPEVLIYKSNI